MLVLSIIVSFVILFPITRHIYVLNTVRKLKGNLMSWWAYFSINRIYEDQYEALSDETIKHPFETRYRELYDNFHQYDLYHPKIWCYMDREAPFKD